MEDYIQIYFENKKYSFERINLVTITYRGKMADKYKCSKTQLIGYRFGVNNYISVPKNKKNTKIVDKFQ